jgi:hypothetical protein
MAPRVLRGAVIMQSTPIGRHRAGKLPDLHTRHELACALLREARSHAGAVGGLGAIDAALDEAERLVPGLVHALRTPPVTRQQAAVAAELRALLDAFERAYCEPVLSST